MTVKCPTCGETFPTKVSLGSHKAAGHDKPWMSEERLHREYVQEGRTSYELAEKWGCDPKTIRNWLERFGIERRQTGEWQRQEYVSLWYTNQGYIYWKDHTPPSRGDSFPVHRLLAIAEYGIDAVKGKHAHHENGVKWDNRVDNIELIDPSDHARMHWEQGDLELQPGGIDELKSEVNQ